MLDDSFMCHVPKKGFQRNIFNMKNEMNQRKGYLMRRVYEENTEYKTTI